MQAIQGIQTTIEKAFEDRASITPTNADKAVREAVAKTIEMLDSGEARVAERKNGQWVVNQWLKKAVLLSFRIYDNELIPGGYTNYFDKVPSKYGS